MLNRRTSVLYTLHKKHPRVRVPCCKFERASAVAKIPEDRDGSAQPRFQAMRRNMLNP